MKFGNYGSHYVQYFRISRIRDVAVVIHENRIQKWGHDVSIDHLMVIRSLNIAINQLQYLLLDGPETADFGHLRRDQTCLRISKFQRIFRDSMDLPSLCTASEIIWLVARYMESISR